MSSLEIQLSLITLIGEETIPLPEDCIAWTVWRYDPPGQRTVRLSPIRQDTVEILSSAVVELNRNSDIPELNDSNRRIGLMMGTANARLERALIFGCITEDHRAVVDLLAVGGFKEQIEAKEAAAIFAISNSIMPSLITILDAERVPEQGCMLQRGRYWAVAWTP